MNNIILKMVHGSHLYGTQTENSDRDYKGIYIPKLEDYLLQNVNNCISSQSGSSLTKNSKNDVDSHIFSLNNFINLCIKGDTCAIDMLHVNEENIIESSDIWKELQSKRSMFYISSLYSYTGYLRQQAAKYSIKGSRLSDCEELVKYLSQFDGDSRLEEYIDKLPQLEGLTINADNIELIEKKFQSRIRIKDIINPLSNFIEKYGQRARDANNNQNIDWKAISHAFRSGYQLKEIYTTGDLQYPLKDKDFLLKVKTGQFRWDNDNISDQLDDLLIELKELSIKSGFPNESDKDYWNKWLISTLKEYYEIHNL